MNNPQSWTALEHAQRMLTLRGFTHYVDCGRLYIRNKDGKLIGSVSIYDMEVSKYAVNTVAGEKILD